MLAQACSSPIPLPLRYSTLGINRTRLAVERQCSAIVARRSLHSAAVVGCVVRALFLALHKVVIFRVCIVLQLTLCSLDISRLSKQLLVQCNVQITRYVLGFYDRYGNLSITKVSVGGWMLRAGRQFGSRGLLLVQFQC